MEHLITTTIGTLYTAASITIAWNYFKQNSRAEYKTRDPFEHVFLTIVLAIITVAWPILVPGWQANQKSVEHKQ